MRIDIPSAQHTDEHRFQTTHIRLGSRTIIAQFENRISDQLTWTMVGDRASSIGSYKRDVYELAPILFFPRPMFVPSHAPGGKYGWVFQQEEQIMYAGSCALGSTASL
jgi:hypothetical protein